MTSTEIELLNEVSDLKGRLVRLEYVLGTLISWMPWSVLPSASQQELLDLIKGMKK